MDPEQELVAVFRSEEMSAYEEAAALRDLLTETGLHPKMVTGEDPGVPKGTVEIWVPASEESKAAEALASARSPAEPVDDSEELDLVTIYEGAGITGEIEAMSIRSLLDSAGIASVLMGTASIPNLPFLVKVPRNMVDQANAAIEAAKAAGPAGADQAEEGTQQVSEEP